MQGTETAVAVPQERTLRNETMPDSRAVKLLVALP